MSLLNKVINAAFAIVGAITGYTLTRTFLSIYQLDIGANIKIAVFILVSAAAGALFYSTASKVSGWILDVLDKVESFIQNMTLYEITISAVGLIIGLIVANLISIPIIKVDVIGVPLAIAINILLGCLGISIALGKRNEQIFEQLRSKGGLSKEGRIKHGPKVLDTSVIIDGRIVDILRSGFLEGELVVPSFILEELRRIADSSDTLKRNRGRRGLDVLNSIQKELGYPMRIENADITSGAEVDAELLKVAKKLDGKILTVDYNLNKVASLQGVPVLNINELANAVKPIALPGEEMVVQVIKDGKENGQGIGYLDDGTMIVVEGGKKYIGENINVTVTSVLQTAAGRMIFAKPKYNIERVI